MEAGMYMLIHSAERLWQTMSINSGNLSSTTVPGYRGDMVFIQALQGNGDNAAVPAKAPGFEMRTPTSFVTGTLRQTGRELDVAIEGAGWLVVEAPDGSEGLTRNGMLRLTALGDLVTGPGYPVLGEGGPINLPEHSQVAIARNGGISIVPMGGGVVEEVAQVRLVNPPQETLERGGYGLFRSTDALDALNPGEAVNLLSGHLEESNVNAIGEYLEMLSVGRNMDVHIRLMKAYNRMAEHGNDVLRPSLAES